MHLHAGAVARADGVVQRDESLLSQQSHQAGAAEVMQAMLNFTPQ